MAKIKIEQIEDLSGVDNDAIHDNVAAEISAITAKGTPTTSDFLLIEDAADSNNKKSITIGDLPSSGGGGSSPILSAYKTADETKTSDNTPVADSDLVIPVEANSIYRLKIFLLINAASTPDFKWALIGPTGIQGIYSWKYGSTNGTVSTMIVTEIISGAGSNRSAIYEGYIQTSATAGDLEFLWSQYTSSGLSTTLVKGSHIILTKL